MIDPTVNLLAMSNSGWLSHLCRSHRDRHY